MSEPTNNDLDAKIIALDRKREHPFRWLDLSGWDDDPIPERRWAIADRVPLNQAGLFSGEGGTGKSIIELTKNVAHVTGKQWLGCNPAQGPAFYVGAEDEVDEIHIRLASIKQHYSVTFGDLDARGLKVLPLLGQDMTLVGPTSGKGGRIEVTALYRWLMREAREIRPKNISIDTLTRAFAGNEIDRVQVYTFAQHMQALAVAAGGSVTVLSHPSLTGITSGSGISGSTAWHGAFRFRQFLKGGGGAKVAEGDQPNGDLRELQFLKNQYGPKSDSISLRYQRGLFVLDGGTSTIDKQARMAVVDGFFLAELARFEAQGRNVSGDRCARNYAPSLFSEAPDAQEQRVTKTELAAAMERLFNDGSIRTNEYGPPSNRKSRLVSK